MLTAQNTRTFNPTGENELTLPQCSLVETLTNPRLAIEAKKNLNEIFNTYLLLSEHGGDLGDKFSTELFYLITGVNEIMDAITLQYLNSDAQ